MGLELMLIFGGCVNVNIGWDTLIFNTRISKEREILLNFEITDVIAAL